MMDDKMNDNEFDPNFHKSRILFQDLLKEKTYFLTVPNLYKQLKEKYKPSKVYNKKEYHNNCLLLEDCYFNETILIEDKNIKLASGHKTDVSFPPSFFTKYRECVYADHILEDSTVIIEFTITKIKGQNGSTKWSINKIQRKENTIRG